MNVNSMVSRNDVAATASAATARSAWGGPSLDGFDALSQPVVTRTAIVANEKPASNGATTPPMPCTMANLPTGSWCFQTWGFFRSCLLTDLGSRDRGHVPDH